jgi:chemotaxis protein MotB
MGKRKKSGGGGGGGGHDGAGGLRWLLTYTDMVTLLLATFIIMWATAVQDTVKFEAVAAAFRTTFGVGQTSVLKTGANEGAKPIVFPQSQLQVSEIQNKLQPWILEQKMDPAINLHLNERGLLIRIYADKVKFAPGSTTLPRPYKKILDKVGRILATTPNAIHVNGYTDNRGNKNWELSALRAVNTVKYLSRKNIAPERMVASGYGEYAPLVPNSDNIRRSINRRIDIQILKAPILDELINHRDVDRVRNPSLAPVSPPRLSPVEGIRPKPLNF